MTHPQFWKFNTDWLVFNCITNISDNQIHAQLYSCCDDHIQNYLVNTITDFSTLTEGQLLTALEQLVTKKSNSAVLCLHFASLIQSNGESIKDYVLRLSSPLFLIMKMSALTAKTNYQTPTLKINLSMVCRTILYKLKSLQRPVYSTLSKMSLNMLKHLKLLKETTFIFKFSQKLWHVYENINSIPITMGSVTEMAKTNTLLVHALVVAATPTTRKYIKIVQASVLPRVNTVKNAKSQTILPVFVANNSHSNKQMLSLQPSLLVILTRPTLQCSITMSS